MTLWSVIKPITRRGPTALTFQRIDLIDPFDEPRPTFSESGALFWRELGFGLGF